MGICFIPFVAWRGARVLGFYFALCVACLAKRKRKRKLNIDSAELLLFGLIVFPRLTHACAVLF